MKALLSIYQQLILWLERKRIKLKRHPRIFKEIGLYRNYLFFVRVGNNIDEKNKTPA